jgi:glucokinase
MVEAKDTVVALLGDIGGTNLRLTLKRLDLKSRTSDTLLPITKYDSQHEASVVSAIKTFLS